MIRFFSTSLLLFGMMIFLSEVAQAVEPAQQSNAVAEQSKAGPTKGSWFFNHGYSRRGGRLYDTALSTLTLEIYYRHLIRWRHAGKGFDFED